MRIRLLLFVGLLCCVPSCAHVAAPPPTLTPHATIAFRNTQVIKVLDLLRDTAIDANAQTPPLVSEQTTRAIVQYHATTLRLMDASVDGWQELAYTGLVELSKSLQPGEQSTLGVYLNLGVTTLKGVLR